MEVNANEICQIIWTDEEDKERNITDVNGQRLVYVTGETMTRKTPMIILASIVF